MQRKKDFQKALDFIKKKHRGQFRAGKVPVWHHVTRVSHLLDYVLEQTGEGQGDEGFIIPYAALGHDLLEDTDATEEEIRNTFGDRGLELILGMTNRWGDKRPAPYVRQVVRSDEGVRLTKLADLYDNITSVTYNLHILGLKWATSYFLPIVSPMHKAVIKTKFPHYKNSSAELIFGVDIAMTLLKKEMQYYRKSIRN